MKKWFVLMMLCVLLLVGCQQEQKGDKAFNVFDYLDQEESTVRKVLEEEGFTIEEKEEWERAYITKGWKVTGTYMENEMEGGLLFYSKDGKNYLAEMEIYHYYPNGETAFAKKYMEDCWERFGEPQGWNNAWDDTETDEAKMAREYLDTIEERADEEANMIWFQDVDGVEISNLSIVNRVSSDNQREIFMRCISAKMKEYDGVQEQIDNIKKEREQDFLQEIREPEIIEIVGHNFIQYLDQDIETIRKSIEAAGLTIEDVSSPDFETINWIINEEIHGWKRTTHLNLGVYGDEKEERLSQIIQKYNLPEDFVEEDKQMISDIYDEICAAYGNPNYLGDYQYRNGDVYERTHFEEMLENERVIAFDTTWGESKTIRRMMSMSVNLQIGHAGATIYVDALSEDADEYLYNIEMES